MAAPAGFTPTRTGSEPVMLLLHHGAKCGSQWACSTTFFEGPSGFQPAAARLSALTSSETHPPTGLAPVSHRYQRRASLSTLWRSFGSGRASRCCPEYLADPNGADCCLPHARGKCGATGNRTPIYAMPLRRLAVRRWPPKVERAPGLAPGKSGVATRRLDDFGIARL